MNSLIKYDILLVFVIIIFIDIFESEILNIWILDFSIFSFFLNLYDISIWVTHFSRFRLTSLSIRSVDSCTGFTGFDIPWTLTSKEFLVPFIKFHCFTLSDRVSNFPCMLGILSRICIFAKTNPFLLFKFGISEHLIIKLWNIFFALVVVVTCFGVLHSWVL